VTVERIRTLPAFDRVRDAYESVYARDAQRTVFVEWRWLRSYFVAIKPRWTLLAARVGSEYVAFCLLIERGAPFGLYRELAFGAYPTADYASLLIASREEEVLGAFASAIAAMRWDVFRANNVADARLGTIAAYLKQGDVVEFEPQNACRFLALPATPGRYVARRRRAFANASFVEADDATIDAYVEVLLRLRDRRWRGNLRKARRTYGRLFREAYARGCCRIGVFWSAERRPLAAQASFVDSERNAWGVYMLAYEREERRHSPGIAMLAASMERATSQGFREFDFLRGDEPYKALFGTEVRLLENFVARRRRLRSRLAEHGWDAAMLAKAYAGRIVFRRTL
jgi:hypothetical protein